MKKYLIFAGVNGGVLVDEREEHHMKEELILEIEQSYCKVKKRD